MSDFLIDGMLRASYKEPGAALTARARHRRVQLPCVPDLSRYEDLLRDLRHQQAVAFPDLEDFLVDLDLAGKRPKTLYGYTREIAPLLRSHPGKRFDEFTPDDVKQELHRKPRASRHITRSIYNVWFTWGVENDRLEKSPMGKVPRIKAPHARPKNIFTEAERDMLEASPSPDGQLWTLLFGAGLRRGEARHLQRRHIDLDRARLMVVDGKGGKDRVVGLPRVTIQAVADLDLLERLGPQDHLWYRPRYPVGDKRRRTDAIGDTTFERWYRNGIEAAGVRYLNPHQTRHTYGWWLRTEGFDLEERQLLLGHEDVRTTKKYDRMSLDDVAEKIAAL